MSTVFKKLQADKIAFNHRPKSFKIETSVVAKDFVKQQTEVSSGFQIADVVAQQSGILALRKKDLETQVEGTVLERLKEIEEQAYKQAYDLGMIEGSEKAFKEKNDDMLARLQKFDSALVSLENYLQSVLKTHEAVIIKLVFQIAKKIAMREIKMNQEPIVDLLNQLVSEIQTSDHVHIKLNPIDLKFIEDLRVKKVKDVEALERVKLLQDEHLTAGGCLVETNYGAIDASIEQRVDRAWQILETKLPVLKTDGKT